MTKLGYLVSLASLVFAISCSSSAGDGTGKGGSSGTAGTTGGTAGTTGGTAGTTGTGGTTVTDGGAVDADSRCPATQPAQSSACTQSTSGAFCVYGNGTTMCVCNGTGTSSFAWLCFNQ